MTCHAMGLCILMAQMAQHGGLSIHPKHHLSYNVHFVVSLTEVSADDAMPCRAVLPVKLLLDEGGDVLLDVELVQAL